MVLNNTTQTRFTMRIENNIYESIKKLAKENKRSIAKQIEFMLEKALKTN